DQSNLDNTQAAVQQLLEQLHNTSNSSADDFTIRNQAQILETNQAVAQSLATLLIGVAAISLLVGGIGIMNIMLVSVTERTCEIGIRLAIGAESRQMLMQFLVEAAVLSLFGGILGVALGLALAALAGHFLNVPFVPNPLIAVAAFAFSALIGVAFGYFPARRAARLNPIDALRHE